MHYAFVGHGQFGASLVAVFFYLVSAGRAEKMAKGKCWKHQTKEGLQELQSHATHGFMVVCGS